MSAAALPLATSSRRSRSGARVANVLMAAQQRAAAGPPVMVELPSLSSAPSTSAARIPVLSSRRKSILTRAAEALGVSGKFGASSTPMATHQNPMHAAASAGERRDKRGIPVREVRTTAAAGRGGGGDGDVSAMVHPTLPQGLQAVYKVHRDKAIKEGLLFCCM
jgi:hypothetical protein